MGEANLYYFTGLNFPYSLQIRSKNFSVIKNDAKKEKQRTFKERARSRAAGPLYQLREVHSQGQIYQEVYHTQYRRGGRGPGYLRRVGVRRICAPQAVCKTPLLRLLCHPFQGRPWKVSRVAKGQNSAAAFPPEAGLIFEQLKKRTLFSYY